MHRNAFTRGAADGSMLFNPLDLNFKNVANTNVLCWGGRMWALWEVSCRAGATLAQPHGVHNNPQTDGQRRRL